VGKRGKEFSISTGEGSGRRRPPLIAPPREMSFQHPRKEKKKPHKRLEEAALKIKHISVHVRGPENALKLTKARFRLIVIMGKSKCPPQSR